MQPRNCLTVLWWWRSTNNNSAFLQYFCTCTKKLCYFEWIEIHPQKLVRPDRKESGQYPHGRNNWTVCKSTKGTSENLNRSPILRLDKDKQVQVTSSCLIMKLHPVHDTHCITLQSCMHHISEPNCISIWHIQRSLDCCGDFILDFTCKPGSHLENHGIQRDEPQKPSQIHLQTSHLHPAPQWSWVKQWWFYFPEAEMLWSLLSMVNVVSQEKNCACKTSLDMFNIWVFK